MKIRICLQLFSMAVFLFIGASTCFAHCPSCRVESLTISPCFCKSALDDGIYFGAGIGYDAYKIHQSLDVLGSGDILSIANPQLSAKGVFGSIFAGYGQYYELFYIAGEISAGASTAKTNYNISTSTNSYTANFDVRTSYAFGILPGLKLNRYTLLYGRLGYTRTSFKSAETVVSPSLALNKHIATPKYSNGATFGLGVETAFDYVFGFMCRPCCNFLTKQLSLRGEYTYTTYSATKSQINTIFSPSNNQFVLSLLYHLPSYYYL